MGKRSNFSAPAKPTRVLYLPNGTKGMRIGFLRLRLLLRPLPRLLRLLRPRRPRRRLRRLLRLRFGRRLRLRFLRFRLTRLPRFRFLRLRLIRRPKNEKRKLNNEIGYIAMCNPHHD